MVPKTMKQKDGLVSRNLLQRNYHPMGPSFSHSNDIMAFAGWIPSLVDEFPILVARFEILFWLSLGWVKFDCEQIHANSIFSQVHSPYVARNPALVYWSSWGKLRSSAAIFFCMRQAFFEWPDLGKALNRLNRGNGPGALADMVPFWSQLHCWLDGIRWVPSWQPQKRQPRPVVEFLIAHG